PAPEPCAGSPAQADISQGAVDSPGAVPMEESVSSAESGRRATDATPASTARGAGVAIRSVMPLDPVHGPVPVVVVTLDDLERRTENELRQLFGRLRRVWTQSIEDETERGE